MPDDVLQDEIAPPLILKLAGKEYKLAFNMLAVIAFKQKTGRNLFTQEGWKDLLPSKDPEAVVAFFWAALQEFHSEISFDKAAKMASFKNLPAIYLKCEEAAVAALPKQEPSPNVEEPAQVPVPLAG